MGKYQNINDINDFIALGDKSFRAISHFPNSRFWDMLSGHKDLSRTFDYFLAVSSFKDVNSEKLLSSILMKLSDKEVEFLCEALASNCTPLYFDLLCNIWEKYKIIDITIAEYLIAENPKKAANSFIKGLLNTKKPKFLEFNYNYGTKYSIMKLMLQCIIENDESALLNVCKSGIKSSSSQDLSTILDYITEFEFLELTDDLLVLLKQKKYPFEIYHISKTLFSFQNSETNLKLVKILENKKNRWNSGKWAQSFTSLFKKNNVVVN